jgi:hypothetical protein
MGFGYDIPSIDENGNDVFIPSDEGGYNSWWSPASTFTGGSTQIPANSMNQAATSGTDWSAVFAKGISRAFDIAGNIAQAQNVPYYQTPAGQQQAAAAANQKTMFMIFAGVALLMMLKKG